MLNWQNWSAMDSLISGLDKGLKVIFSNAVSNEISPASTLQDEPLNYAEKKHSIGLMRVNHSGEICAQALYQGHALSVSSEEIRAHMLKAADEESAHLAWCEERVKELGGRTSKLNLFWYLGSYFIGYISGIKGEAYALGFITETERQVVEHLKRHLQLLPQNDAKSRSILFRMCQDEQKHADQALLNGAMELPVLIKFCMKNLSKVMTTVTYWV